VARLTLRSRSDRGVGASQRITCLGEDISPLITPESLKNRNGSSTEARSAPAVGTVVGALVRARAAHADGNQPRNPAAAHDN
jgi:hypothetical protein